MKPVSRWTRTGIAALSLLGATLVWLPAVHWLFKPDLATVFSDDRLPAKAEEMAERHLKLWRDPVSRETELQAMRRSNAEWDFMGRTFLVMAFAEMAVRDPSLEPELLPIMDAIIDETLRSEAEHGMHYFLMPYSRSRHYVVQPARSLFIDGEIAMMLAMRRVVQEHEGYRELLAERTKRIATGFSGSASMALESYPDECWLFDHAMAMAAVRVSDYLDRTDHSRLIANWLSKAKEKLVDPKTGLLVSSYTTDATPLDGPEGSSIWLAVHCLRLIDPEFAEAQFTRAKAELKRELCGFAWSKEWPSAWEGPLDIDSGAVVPVLEVSAGGSGLAFIAAASFRDLDFLRALHTTLDFAALPVRENGALRYAASNQVGDSAMLYSMVLGPVWKRVLEKLP